MTTTGSATRRRLPGTTSTCQLCKQPVVWATTVAGPNGPGGKSQCFEPMEHPDGNVAIIARGRGRLWARALSKDERVDLLLEYQGMPHVAVCKKAPAPGGPVLPDNVVDLGQRRRQRGAR